MRAASDCRCEARRIASYQKSKQKGLGSAELSPQLKVLSWAAAVSRMGAAQLSPARWYDTQELLAVGHHQKYETESLVCYDTDTALMEQKRACSIDMELMCPTIPSQVAPAE